MAERFFYILSYPRCRSTWFSQFFRTNVSYCYHERLSGNHEGAFDKFMLNFDRPYVGSADTNPVSFCRADRVPGPMVIIERPIEDVKRSLLKAFHKHEAFTDEEWSLYIDNTLDMFEIIIGWYKQNEPNVMVVQFNELDNHEKLLEIFNHCIKNYTLSVNYVKHMNGLSITLRSKDGMRDGIETSRKNRGMSIEVFKDIHLNRYDSKKFREDFYNQAKVEESPKPLYMGSRGKQKR